jgi:hypothetical protein
VVCEWCGGSFRAATGKQRFCGSTCRYRARDRGRHPERGTRMSARCRECGDEFVYVSATRPRVYCLACRPPREVAT